MQEKYSHARVDCRNKDLDGIMFVLILISKSREWPWIYRLSIPHLQHKSTANQTNEFDNKYWCNHYWSRLSFLMMINRKKSDNYWIRSL